MEQIRFRISLPILSSSCKGINYDSYINIVKQSRNKLFLLLTFLLQIRLYAMICNVKINPLMQNKLSKLIRKSFI